MKKLLVATLMLLCLVGTRSLFAQENKRFSLTLTISADGKKVTMPIQSANYSFYKGDTSANSAYVYLSFSLGELSKDAIKILASKKGVDGVIEKKDNFGKLPTRTISFKNGTIESASESFAAYDSGYEGGSSAGYSSLSLKCHEATIDGVEIKM